MSIEELRRVSNVKKTFPDGTVIGPWWCRSISKLLQKAKEITSWNELTQEEQEAIYTLAQIDEIRGDILDFAGKLSFIKKHLSVKELQRISKVKKTFPDGTVIGQWWQRTARKKLVESIQKDANELTEEEHYILKVVWDILMLYQNITLDESVKLALLKRNQK